MIGKGNQWQFVQDVQKHNPTPWEEENFNDNRIAVADHMARFPSGGKKLQTDNKCKYRCVAHESFVGLRRRNLSNSDRFLARDGSHGSKLHHVLSVSKDDRQ